METVVAENPLSFATSRIVTIPETLSAKYPAAALLSRKTHSAAAGFHGRLLRHEPLLNARNPNLHNHTRTDSRLTLFHLARSGEECVSVTLDCDWTARRHHIPSIDSQHQSVAIVFVRLEAGAELALFQGYQGDIVIVPEYWRSILTTSALGHPQVNHEGEAGARVFDKSMNHRFLPLPRE